MNELAEYLPEETKQETMPEQNTSKTIVETSTSEVGYSFIQAFLELWSRRLTDSDEELAKQRSILEQMLAGSKGIERGTLRQKLLPIIMEQRFRKDPEAERIFEQWQEVQFRAMDEYTAWEKEIKEKYGDKELGRRILANEYPKYEYKPGEEELWYKLMRIEVEEGVRPKSMLKFVEAVEDAGGFRNWEQHQQEQISKELGSPEHIQPDSSGISTGEKIADIQQELKITSSLQ